MNPLNHAEVEAEKPLWCLLLGAPLTEPGGGTPPDGDERNSYQSPKKELWRAVTSDTRRGKRFLSTVQRSC